MKKKVYIIDMPIIIEASDTNTGDTMEYHELCLLYPEDSEAIDNIEKDMQENGFVSGHEIVLLDGKILDGRHRFLAAVKADLAPQFTEYDGDDPLAYVIRENSNRRNLSVGQRAVIADQMANLTHKTSGKRTAKSSQVKKDQAPKGISIDEAAKATGTSRSSIKSARSVGKSDPKMYEQIRAGKISLGEATKKTAAKKRTIKSQTPDAWDDVESGKIDIDKAAAKAQALADEARKKKDAEKKKVEQAEKHRKKKEAEIEYQKRQAKKSKIQKDGVMVLHKAFDVFGIHGTVLAKIDEGVAKAIYRYLVKQKHPDTGGSAEELIELNIAYNTLKLNLYTGK